jgi:hypothetical protein
MISDQNRLMEGMASFQGGANSAVDPSLVNPTQYSWAKNVVVRDGYPATRPGFKYIKALPDGVVQGASYFDNKANNTQEMISLINGKLYSLKPTEPAQSVVDISPSGETNPYVSQKSSMAQANKFLVVQDGVSRALVYNGTSSFRSVNNLDYGSPSVEIEEAVMGANNAAIALSGTTGLEPGMLVLSDSGAIQTGSYIVSVDNTTSSITLNKVCTKSIVATLKFYLPGEVQNDISIPVGDVVAYGNGRLWVANKQNLFAGDLVGTYQDSEIKFSETIYLAGGGSFYFDSNITGLVFLPGPDTSVGQGDLIVFTQTDINAVAASVYDRLKWQETPGMQRKIFVGRGSESQDSIIVTDRDIYFRSLDGIRSLAQTASGSGSVVTFADSLEATRITAFDTDRWLKYCPGILFDSRYLVGGAPKVQRVTDSNGNYTGKFNVVFEKLVVRDFNAGAVTGQPAPVYDGEWSGLQICKLIEGRFNDEKKCFAITCDSDGKNSLYEITLGDKEDYVKETRTSSPVTRPISCEVETRRFSFETPFDVKEFYRADLAFTDVSGNLSWDLKYTPDFYTKFYNVQNVAFSSAQERAVLTTQSPPDLTFGYRLNRTVKPVSVCVDNSKRLSNFGFMFQAKISWTGKAKLVLFRLHASRKDISDLGECPG